MYVMTMLIGLTIASTGFLMFLAVNHSIEYNKIIGANHVEP